MEKNNNKFSNDEEIKNIIQTEVAKGLTDFAKTYINNIVSLSELVQSINFDTIFCREMLLTDPKIKELYENIKVEKENNSPQEKEKEENVDI